MRTPENDHDNKLGQLLAAHGGLPPLEKTIVHVLAVIDAPTARTNILYCLKKIFSHNDEIKRFKVREIDTPLQKLAGLEIVLQDGSHFVCNPIIREPICRALAAQNRFDDIAAAVQSVLSVGAYFEEPYYVDCDQLVRDLRIGLYRGDFVTVRELMAIYQEYHATAAYAVDPFAYIFRDGVDIQWVADHLPRDLQLEVVRRLIGSLLDHALHIHPNILEFLTDCAGDMDEEDYGRGVLECILAEDLILKGNVEEAKRRIPAFSPLGAALTNGWIGFLEGEYGKAISLYETALKLTRKLTRKRKMFLINRSGLFFILALIKSGTPQHLKKAQAHVLVVIDNASFGYHTPAFALKDLIEQRRGLPEQFEPLGTGTLSPYSNDTISSLVEFLAVYWMDRNRVVESGDSVRKLLERAKRNGFDWLAAELAKLLSRLYPKETHHAQKAPTALHEKHIPGLVDLIKPQSKWKRALNALINLEGEKSGPAGRKKTYRLVWLLSHDTQYGQWGLSPRQQVLTQKGKWSKGRKVALKRLYREIDTFDFITPQDRAICACIDEERSYSHGYPNNDYHFSEKALAALAGHSLVFRFDSPRTPVEVVKVRPELVADQLQDGQFELTLYPPVDPGQRIRIIEESPTRFKIVETDDAIDHIGRIIGSGLVIPAAGKSKLLKAMDRAAAMVTIQSQIPGTGGQMEKAAADPTPNIHLRPLGRGLKLEILVRPFSRGGPCFRPGEGKATILSDIDGRRFSTQRELDEEKRLAEKVVSGCPTLSAMEDAADGMWGWEIHAPPDCLETLLSLRELETPVAIH